MLTYDDNPTIRHAILKRLDAERGVKVCEIKIEPHLLDPREPFIAVGVLLEVDRALDGGLLLSGVFHLPAAFELRHLHNEIDEIAESAKSARIDVALTHGTRRGERKVMLGTGLRGRWQAYG